MTTKETFALIKKTVQDITPDADVSLFGSRANHTATEESDWDVLILTKYSVPKKVKQEIQEKLFPLSLSLSSFINIVVVSKKEWKENPAYYSLQQSILSKAKQA